MHALQLQAVEIDLRDIATLKRVLLISSTLS